MHKKIVTMAVIISGIFGMGSANLLSDYINKVSNNIKLKEENAILRTKLDKKKKELNLSKKKCKDNHIEKIKNKEQESIKTIEFVDNSNMKLINYNKNEEEEIETATIVNEEPVEMTLTFYGDLAEENGGYAGKDAQGNKLTHGTVASNVYDFGTKFELNGEIYTVKDRGGSNFNSSNRLDMFVPRYDNETDNQYKKRIASYGKQTVTMYKR